ncbi:MAG: molybdopterin-dependent oxidoreductase, partial [Neisseriaceae bacterium]|nr:molybdopterin-dependent oxidoreductase [Neisseriaceae bacterium]
SATVSIDLMGGLSVVIASTPAGQGHMTVCAQVVADVFGVGIDDVVTNVELDTQKDAWSAAAGNYSSRFAGAVAGTVHLAATKLRDKVARIAAKHFAVAAADIVFNAGLVYPLGQEARALTLSRASGSAHWAVALLPDTDEPGLRETVFWSPPTLAAPNDDDQINTSATYGFVFDVCAVDIDPHSGQVHIDRYVTAHDAGKILNPALADGQIRGAFAQGLGAALMEEFQYGTDGSFQSATLVDYLMPTACEVPDPIIVHLETPSPFTPLGAKGLAEGNNMSTPVCIANAVADALSLLHPNQDLDLRLPLTPLKLMTLIGMDEPAPKNAVARAEPAPQEDAPTTGQGKQLRAQGNVMIHASPEAVFAILLNPEALAKVIPGCHSLNTIGKHHYQADVVIGVGLIKARYAAEIQLQHLNPPHSLHLNGVGKSSLGDASGRGEVTLEAVTGGTRLNYTYTAEVGGKIASVGGRMLEGAAKVVLNKLFEQLGKQAAGRPQATGWWHKLLQRFGVKK